MLFCLMTIMLSNSAIFGITDKQRCFRKILLRDIIIGTTIPVSCGIFATIALSNETTKEKMLTPLVGGICGILSSLLGTFLGIKYADRKEANLNSNSNIKLLQTDKDKLICAHFNKFSLRWTCVSGLLIGAGAMAFITLKNGR